MNSLECISEFPKIHTHFITCYSSNIMILGDARQPHLMIKKVSHNNLNSTTKSGGFPPPVKECALFSQILHKPGNLVFIG